MDGLAAYSCGTRPTLIGYSIHRVTTLLDPPGNHAARLVERATKTRLKKHGGVPLIVVPEFAQIERRLRQSPMIDARIGVLAAVGFGWFLLLGIRLVIPALFPSIKAEFVFSNTIAGSIYTTLLAVAALLQFPGGIIADRIGGRSVLALGFGAGLSGVALLTVAPVVSVFVLGVVLFGIGTGIYGTPRVTVLSAVYPERDATAIGICSAAGNVGTTALPVVAGVVTAAVGWRYGFGVALPLFVVGVVLLWQFVPADAGRTASTSSPRVEARRILAGMNDRSVLMASAIMMVMFFTYQGLTAFLPTYLVAMKSLSPKMAATLFGAFFAGGVVFQVVGGNLSDRFGHRRMLVTMLLASAVPLFLLPFTAGLPSLIVVVLSMSVVLGFWPSAFSYTIAALPDEVQASGLGLLRTVYLLVGSFGSTVVGVMADAGHFDGAFLLLSGLALTSAVLAAFLPTSTRKD